MTAAARIIRVEKLEIQINGKQDNGYLVVLEGICRLRIDRFTMTGIPYFEAQVTAFPRKGGKSLFLKSGIILASGFFEYAGRISLATQKACPLC